MNHAQRLNNRLMNEHIHLPGVPQIVVTRGFAYGWLKKIGHDESERGYGSIDYMVFAARSTEEPLTDTHEPVIARFLEAVEREFATEH